MSYSKITAASALATALLAPSATAQINFSIDHHAPTISTPDLFFGVPITAGDILTTGFGVAGISNPAGLVAPAPPALLRSGGFGPPALGLGIPTHGLCVGSAPGVACPIEVDALSYGLDYWWQAGIPAPGTVWFSVDEFASGIPSAFPSAADVFSEGSLAPGAPNFEAAGDAFMDMGFVVPAPLPPFASPPANTGALDGDGLPNAGGVTYPGVGLLEPAMPMPITPDMGDNQDGMDVDTFGPGPFPTYYSMDALWADPLTGVPWSGTAAVNGFAAADVVQTLAPGAGPVMYAPAALLGLDVFGPQTDDLDALILWENTVPGYQVSSIPYDWLPAGGSDMLFFSVRRGSAVVGSPDSIFGIPIEPGDILTTPLPTASGGVSPFPGIWIAAENLALATLRSGTAQANHGDELDSLDAVSFAVIDCNSNGIHDALDIALGGFADVNTNGIPDMCETVIIDCNGNGIDDAIDLTTGTSLDCNSNGIPDECDIASGTSTDVNSDGVPDECQVVSTSGCFCSAAAPPPCGNVFATAGCMNSTGVGASCTTSGTSSVANDDMVLMAGPIVPGEFGVFFMGSAAIGPFPFGDGLRCAGGAVRRFPVVPADASGTLTFGPVVSTYPAILVPFSVWHFQGWYRDPGGPCGSSFNLTDRLTVTFTP